MRGYAFLPILEAIQKKAGKNLLECFDLVGGTSVGGITALLCSRVDNLESGIDIMRDMIDDVRETSFEGLITASNVVRLITTGSLLHKDHQIIKTMKKRYPKESLLNLEGVPAFVVTAKKREQKTEDKEVKFEPFILRSYHHPDEIKTKSSLKRNDHHTTLADSSSSVLLCEAMAATSAVPPVVDRVKVNVNGEEVVLGDGALISECPVVHAFDEASRLYPDRPIGVILSIGFTKDANNNVHRAVDVMRMSSPSLHYQRITPHDIMEPFKCEESDLSKIAIMEKKVKEYMHENVQVNNSLNITIDRLLASRSLRKFSKTMIENTAKVAEDIRKDSSYRRRLHHRKSVCQKDDAVIGLALGKTPTIAETTKGNRKSCHFFCTRNKNITSDVVQHYTYK